MSDQGKSPDSLAEEPQAENLADKLNRETASIAWAELQPFFARGQAVRVKDELDLIEVATAFAEDHSSQVKGWISDNSVARVSEVEAAQWSEQQQVLWAVVVAPWVLVQPRQVH